MISLLMILGTLAAPSPRICWSHGTARIEAYRCPPETGEVICLVWERPVDVWPLWAGALERGRTRITNLDLSDDGWVDLMDVSCFMNDLKGTGR